MKTLIIGAVVGFFAWFFYSVAKDGINIAPHPWVDSAEDLGLMQ